MTTPYVDPQSIHNPATGTSPPASWGDTVRDDLEFLIQPPSCRIVRSSTQSISNLTLTAVNFNAADSWDTDALHDTVTNNNRITIPSGLGGKYLCIANVIFGASATGDRFVEWRVNGTTEYRGQFVKSATATTELNYSAIISLSAGDYLEVMVYHSAGGALNIDSAWAQVLFVSR